MLSGSPRRLAVCRGAMDQNSSSIGEMEGRHPDPGKDLCEALVEVVPKEIVCGSRVHSRQDEFPIVHTYFRSRTTITRVLRRDFKQDMDRAERWRYTNQCGID